MPFNSVGMNSGDYLSIRFHFRGTSEHDGKEWIYKGGRQGMSTVQHSKLSIAELKKHLSIMLAVRRKSWQGLSFAGNCQMVQQRQH